MAQRPYGYSSDYEPIPDEVAILREVRDRVVAGDSMLSIAADLSNRQVPTVRGGGTWRAPVLMSGLCNPRVVGRMERRDGTLAPGPYPAIFSQEEYDEVIAALDERKRPESPTPRKALLSRGVLRCGVCNSAMHPSMQGAGRARTYRCVLAEGGCGKVKAHQAMVDNDIEGEILPRLASPELMAPVHARAKKNTAAKVVQERDDLKLRLEELGVAYAAGTVDLVTVEAATEASRERLAALETSVARDEVVLDFPKPNLPAVARWWTEASMERRAATVRVFIDRIQVMPTKQGRRTSAMDRLIIDWRN